MYRTEDINRFWSKVDTSGDCWVWTAAKSIGYGKIYMHGRPAYAHRVSFEMTYGAVPEGLIVRHRCDNPSCVNPSHLELGTFADNTMDMVSRGRAAYVAHPREQNGRAKLTQEQVDEIRERYTGRFGEKAAMARRYGVNRTAIGNIILGKSWR